ncbi:hypothetical protein IFM89_034024 [Coptis chinensis]|uniref:F-box domain-containing protein n=1 Tax=Coptis chinensis TaxID=261450 RepID=A0A835ISI7_9MAGN|nr:hypothetical protein IFM89_034024 [Coptis chinensis]
MDQMACLWNVPEDISLNIFSRLHIRYLIRCKSVCKSWYTLISNPYLVPMHLSRAPQLRDPDILVFVNHIKRLETDEIAYHIDNTKSFTIENVGCNDESKKPLPVLPPHLRSFGVCGSCNGLLCLGDSGLHRPVTDPMKIGELYVWNPFTGEILQLPTCNTIGIHAFSFGQNPILNEYMVLAMTKVYPDDFGDFYDASEDYECELKIEMCTLGSASWTIIRNVPFIPVTSHSSGYFLLDGALHWLARKEINQYSVGISSLDLGNQTFQFTPLPPEIAHDDRCYHFGTLGGCLYTVDFDRHSPSHIDIWILKQFGVMESWSKVYVISLDEENFYAFRPVCVFKCGEVLIVFNNNSWALYDPKSGRRREIRFLGTGDRGSSRQVFAYTGTLVSPTAMPCNELL